MAESTVGWFGVREKYCLLADKTWLISQIRLSEQAEEHEVANSRLIPWIPKFISVSMVWINLHLFLFSKFMLKKIVSKFVYTFILFLENWEVLVKFCSIFLLNFNQNEKHSQTFEREADLQALPVGSDNMITLTSKACLSSVSVSVRVVCTSIRRCQVCPDHLHWLVCTAKQSLGCHHSVYSFRFGFWFGLAFSLSL